MKVSGSWGSGTTERSHPIAANSAIRPSAVARPSSGSGCDVKNCHGVEAAHSSPMNSMGVNGESTVSTAAIASPPSSSDCESRSPAARFPIWSWS